jgi:hypothetical protein
VKLQKSLASISDQQLANEPLGGKAIRRNDLIRNIARKSRLGAKLRPADIGFV